MFPLRRKKDREYLAMTFHVPKVSDKISNTILRHALKIIAHYLTKSAGLASEERAEVKIESRYFIGKNYFQHLRTFLFDWPREARVGSEVFKM